MYGYKTKLLESFFNTDLKTNLMTLNVLKSKYKLNEIMQFLSKFVRPTVLFYLDRQTVLQFHYENTQD